MAAKFGPECVRGWSAAGALAVAAAAGVVQVSFAQEQPAEAQAGAVARTVTFDTERTTAVAGRTRVLAFRVSAAPGEKWRPEAAVGDASVLEVLREPAVAAGSMVGFLRVAALKEGRTTVSINGASMVVDVLPSRPGGQVTATITSPASGAAVWGTFAVGVEMDADADVGTPRLRLSDGRELEPDVTLTPRLVLGDPTRRLVYQVDATDAPVGAMSLQLVTGAGEDIERLAVRVVKPAEGEVFNWEAEAPFEGERPERFGRNRLTVTNDPSVSGGRYVNNASSTPAVCFPLHVEHDGLYQVMLVAGGTLAGGAMPTVELVVDGQGQAATNGRLVSEQWHRIALGVPVQLAAGDHVLTPYFANDFYVGKLPGGGQVDRNLKLDRIEVLRLGGGMAKGEVASGEMMAGGAGGEGGAMMAAQGMMAGGMAGGEMDGLAALGIDCDDPMGESAVPLRIGLARPLDGLAVTGAFEVEAQAWVPGPDRSDAKAVRAPRVSLLVNGVDLAGPQRSLTPRFLVDPTMLKAGQNTLELVARLRPGVVARTPEQHVTWSGGPSSGDAVPRRYLRYTLLDERWSPTVRERLTREMGPRERVAAGFASEGLETLTLPADLVGRFEVLIEARGQDFKGPAEATVRLETDDPRAVTLVGRLPARGSWDPRAVGVPVELRPGAKRLTVAFENDEYQAPGEDGKGGGDRNLYVQAVALSEVMPKDSTAPIVVVEYPAVGAEVFGADAVVARVSDDRQTAWAELVLDDVATGIRLEARKPGRIVLPLLLRDVPAGTHTVAVRAADASGNEAVSEPVKVQVPERAPAQPGKYERALRMLDRFAYGPEPGELAAVLAMGEREWLSDRLSRPASDPGDEAAMGAALVQFPGRNVGEVQRRALLHALLTPNPARTRFVLWTENHFSTWVRKTEGPRKWSEHAAFARLGPASFLELLEASARSSAMLRYLDQEDSYASRLNENYAREIMELHTLGVHGGYTQEDVTNLARLLTGWTTSREGDGRNGGDAATVYTFRFDPLLNDRAPIRVVGVDFPGVIDPRRAASVAADADRMAGDDRVRYVLETLAAHPSTARFVSRKLAEHYIGFPATDEVVEHLASVFTRTGGDMKEVLLAIAAHPAFWAVEPGTGAPAVRLAHPQDFALRLSRVLRRTNAGQLADFLARSGNGLFDRPTPDGYPEEDSAYTDSNAMVQRWRLAQESGADLASLVPEPLRREAEQPEDWSQRVVDVLAVRLTGRLLSERSNKAALELLNSTSGKRYERVQKVAPFVGQLPEANLR